MIRCPTCHQRLRDGRCADHRAAPVSAPTLLASPPASLVGWRTGPCLGVGGTAQVFALAGEREAVVKWARWRDDAIRRRFEHEAALLRRLGGDVVPALLDAGMVDGWPYLVVERLTGWALSEQIARESIAQTHDAAVARWIALARAVERLHARDVVHGDLKPENVFCTERGARLIDLGMGTALDASAPLTEIGGTIHYISPEQLGGAAPGAASDIYALGVIGFELLTGRPPFVGDRAMIEYGHNLCRPPRVPGAIGDVIAACLAKTASTRPDAGALVAMLERTRSSSAATASMVSTVSGTARRGEHGTGALVWVTGGNRAVIARLVAEAAGRIVRERPEGTLAAFLWHDHDAPVRAAVSLARRLPQASAAVIHRAPLLVRRTGSRVLVHGDDADRPEIWCPTSPWTSVLVTSAAAEQLGLDLAPESTAPAFHVLEQAMRAAGARTATVPDLVAHDELFEDASARVHAAIAGGAPALVTIEGGAGAGKSRALEEIRRRVAGRARVIVLGASVPVGGRPTVRPELAAALAEEAGITDLDRLRRAARAGLVVILDDAHLVEDEVLALLDTAAGWYDARLAIVIAADPSFAAARPRWGGCATNHIHLSLTPLDDAAAHRLLRRELAPARRIPDAIITRLAARAAGNPGALVGLARELHRRGLVRCYPGSEERYVASDEIDDAILEPDRRQRAARELARLPAGMATLVRLCAALGAGFDLDELTATQCALSDADLTIDPAAGVAWLRGAGILRAHGGGWAIAETAVVEAALDSLPSDERVAIHAAALAHLTAQAPVETGEHGSLDRLDRIAHHARGAGQRTLAAAIFVELARRARLGCAYVEAERMATLAIEALGDTSPDVLARALAERGRARRPMARYEAARADLHRARELADATAQAALAIEAMIDDGAICDFTDRLVDSAAAIEAAAARVDGGTPAGTRARVANWLGVVRARQGRLDDALALLVEAIDLATANGDDETAIGSMLMLGGIHRRARRVDEARVVLDHAIARSEARGDAFHVTVGLFNRINLWRVLGAFEAAERDCARAIEIAERHGYGQMEIAGWLNLSEVCLAVGRENAALDAGRRGFAIACHRFGDRPPVVATTWLAFLEAGHGHRDVAARLFAQIDAAETARSPLLSLRRMAVASVLEPAPALDDVRAGASHLEAVDRMAFDWFLVRCGALPSPLQAPRNEGRVDRAQLRVLARAAFMPGTCNRRRSCAANRFSRSSSSPCSPRAASPARPTTSTDLRSPAADRARLHRSMRAPMRAPTRAPMPAPTRARMRRPTPGAPRSRSPPVRRRRRAWSRAIR